MALDIFAAVNATVYNSLIRNESVAKAIAQYLRRANVTVEDQVNALGTALAQFLTEASVTTQPNLRTQLLGHAFQVLEAAVSAGLIRN